MRNSQNHFTLMTTPLPMFMPLMSLFPRVFPELFKSRLPRYQTIADQYGYTVDANDAATVKNEADFIRLIADALAKQS